MRSHLQIDIRAKSTHARTLSSCSCDSCAIKFMFPSPRPLLFLRRRRPLVKFTWTRTGLSATAAAADNSAIPARGATIRARGLNPPSSAQAWWTRTRSRVTTSRAGTLTAVALPPAVFDAAAAAAVVVVVLVFVVVVVVVLRIHRLASLRLG